MAEEEPEQRKWPERYRRIDKGHPIPTKTGMTFHREFGILLAIMYLGRRVVKQHDDRVIIKGEDPKKCSCCSEDQARFFQAIMDHARKERRTKK